MTRPAVSPAFARTSRSIVSVLAVASLLAFLGCGKDDKNPSSGGPGGGTVNSSFTGFLTDGAQSGKIVVTVNSTSLSGRFPGLMAPQAVVTASAVFDLGAGNVTVTGSYDEEADTLNLTGSGYTFHGDYESGGDSPSIAGFFTGPGGPGVFASVTNALLPKVYCGRWQNAAVSDSGTFNFVANDTAFAGFAVAANDPEPSPQTFVGLVSGTGTTRTLNGSGGDVSTAVLSVTGTLNTTTGAVSGTWDYTVYDVSYGTDDNGTWSGQLKP